MPRIKTSDVPKLPDLCVFDIGLVRMGEARVYDDTKIEVEGFGDEKGLNVVYQLVIVRFQVCLDVTAHFSRDESVRYVQGMPVTSQVVDFWDRLLATASNHSPTRARPDRETRQAVPATGRVVVGGEREVVMTLTEFLQQCGVPYRTSGEDSHCSEGWLQLMYCPTARRPRRGIVSGSTGAPGRPAAGRAGASRRRPFCTTTPACRLPK